MISCTEFIAAYSELFSFLAERHGEDQVRDFWKYLFEPDGKGIPLINFIKEEGIRGCFSYWKGTLNEEAADFTMYLNENRGYFKSEMRACPSKGRLLKLKDEIGLQPYPNYCFHCDYYRAAVEAEGLKYIYDFQGCDHASCGLLIYDPNRFDGRIVVDEDTVIMERHSADNEYFHPDFHSSMNMGVDYLYTRFGLEEVKAYLYRFTNNVYRKTMDEIRAKGLKCLEQWIIETYRKEKSPDAVETQCDAQKLDVTVRYCPAVRHLKKTGRIVSEVFPYTTQYVMEAIAEACALQFEMRSYDKETGSADYLFTNHA